MTEQTLCDVPSCDRPSDGWIACKACGEELRSALREIHAWLLDDLELVIARAVRYSSGGPKARSAETPVLVNTRASDVKHGLVNELVTTARMIAEDNDLELPEVGDGTVPSVLESGRAAAAWLHDEVSRIRLHVAGGQMVADLIGRYETAQRVTDRPPVKWYAGICSWDLGDDIECDQEIYASTTSGSIICTKCGNAHDIAERRATLLKAAENVLVTGAEAAAAITAWSDHDTGSGRFVNRIGTWRDRGRLSSRGHVEVGGQMRPIYRLGDILDLLTEAKRRAESKAG